VVMAEVFVRVRESSGGDGGEGGQRRSGDRGDRRSREWRVESGRDLESFVIKAK
jgi:hypothetical protein